MKIGQTQFERSSNGPTQNKILGREIKIPKNAKICKSLFSKCLGLMFSKPKPVLLVNSKESRTGIHMFFVFFPLDIIWLDSNYKIIDFRKNVKPFSGFYYPKKPAKYVLEMPIQS